MGKYVGKIDLLEIFDPHHSDIGLIVEIEESKPIERREQRLTLGGALEALLERKVDLLSNPQIDNPYLKASIDRSKRLLYDGASQKRLI